MEDFRNGFFVSGNGAAPDLVNTTLRLDGALVDLIPDWSAAIAWARTVGVHDAKERRTSASFDATGAMKELRGLRDVTRRLLQSMTEGVSPKTSDVQLLQRAIEPVVGHGVLVEDGGRPRLVESWGEPGEAGLVGRVALGVARFLTSAEPARVRRCGNEQCLIFFYDTSKPNTRRWCSMAACGNTAKVRAYRAKNAH
jgi:predicted RNA-binding Zn ribbon-like protein